MINDDPYSPNSQGMVERIHLTIRYALLSVFLDDELNYDIIRALPIVMNNYNNTIHRTTNHTPYEVFYIKNKVLFNNV